MLSLLIGLLLLLLVLLAVPLGLEFQLSRYQRLEGWLRIRWAFGLIRLELPIPGKQDDEAMPTPSRDKTKNAPSPGHPLQTLRSAAFRRRLLRLLSALWRAIDMRKLQLTLRIGLEDPADTGQLWAVLGPLSGMLYAQPRAELRLEPEFLYPCLEYEGEGELQVIPLQLLTILIAALLSPALWRGLRPSPI